MDSAEQAELLSRLLDAGGPAYGVDPEVASLLRLARDCQRLTIPGPTPAQQVSLAERFDRTRGRRTPLFSSFIAGRPTLTQKLAAAGLAVSLVGGGTAYASGVTPGEAVSETASFIHSVVLNLDPRDSGAPGPAVTPTPGTETATPGTPIPTPSPTTPAPTTSAAATASPTVHHDDDNDDDDDDSDDDDDEKKTPGARDDDGERR